MADTTSVTLIQLLDVWLSEILQQHQGTPNAFEMQVYSQNKKKLLANLSGEAPVIDNLKEIGTVLYGFYKEHPSPTIMYIETVQFRESIVQRLNIFIQTLDQPEISEWWGKELVKYKDADARHNCSYSYGYIV